MLVGCAIDFTFFGNFRLTEMQPMSLFSLQASNDCTHQDSSYRHQMYGEIASTLFLARDISNMECSKNERRNYQP